METVQLLNMPYESCIQYLIQVEKTSSRDFMEFISNPFIKEKLIQKPNTLEFIRLINQVDDRFVFGLLDNQAFESLQVIPNGTEKMRYLLMCGRDFVGRLFYRYTFCDYVLMHLDEYLDCFAHFSSFSASYFVEYVSGMAIDRNILRKIIMTFPPHVRLKLLSSLPVSLQNDVIYSVSDLNPEGMVKEGIDSLKDFNFSEIYYLFSTQDFIPYELLSEKEFLHTLTTMENVKDYRFLMNALGEHQDVSWIEEQRKKYYDLKIKEEWVEGMSPFYYQIYLTFINGITTKQPFAEWIRPYSENYFSFQDGVAGILQEQLKICRYYECQDVSAFKTYLQRLSHLALTDIVIDYHFQEFTYNVLADSRQLLQFKKMGGTSLSKEDESIYQKLITLDDLSLSQKRVLHEELKKQNWQEKFYQDIRLSKDESYQLLHRSILKPDTLKPFQNEELSNQMGVPIYELKGNPFYALVKSLSFLKSIVLKPELLRYEVDASSYSVVSANCLKTYMDPRDIYHVLYVDFPVDQVVHMYPVDSYSKYIRGVTSNASRRIHQIMTPQEFTTSSSYFNELVIAQKNTMRKDDEVNDTLKNPKMFALYCYDRITENDIASAKNLGLSIVLVHTKNYPNQVSSNGEFEKIKDTGKIAYEDGFDYLTAIEENEYRGRIK